jgi:hypothetical protein
MQRNDAIAAIGYGKGIATNSNRFAYYAGVTLQRGQDPEFFITVTPTDGQGAPHSYYYDDAGSAVKAAFEMRLPSQWHEATDDELGV